MNKLICYHAKFRLLYFVFRGEEDEEEDDGPDTDRKEKVSKLILLFFIDMKNYHLILHKSGEKNDNSVLNYRSLLCIKIVPYFIITKLHYNMVCILLLRAVCI